jgi:hypothetical protein
VEFAAYPSSVVISESITLVMPFMAATLGGRLGSGLRVACFCEVGFFAVALDAGFFAVFAFALGVAFFTTGFY